MVVGPLLVLLKREREEKERMRERGKGREKGRRAKRREKGQMGGEEKESGGARLQLCEWLR